MSRRATFVSACAVMAAFPAIAAAQGISGRVASAGDGMVQFHFNARDGVCGNGRTFMRSEDGGSYYTVNNGMGTEECAKGPVRVVMTKAGKDIVRIDTYAGPLVTDAEAGRDLGAVPAREAASYLLTLATTLDGRPAREALSPAMLADSAVVTPQLLQLAKDQARSRDLRRSAISWAVRRRNEAGGVGATMITRAIDQIVRDKNESETIRQQALSNLGSLDRGEGTPILIAFAGDQDTWLSKNAFSTLARSGDPRARQFIRTAVRRTDLAEESRVAAIQGIGGDYATGEDLKLLRDIYPTLSNDRERDALISAVASAGGSDNATWLIALAKSSTEPMQRRKRAVSLLSRFDDPRVREALKEMIEH